MSDAPDHGFPGQSSIMALIAAASSAQLTSTPRVNSELKFRQVTRPGLTVVAVEVTDVVSVEEALDVAVLVTVDVCVSVVTVVVAVVVTDEV